MLSFSGTYHNGEPKTKIMAKTRLDNSFFHYGIRREDISLIESLCTQHQLDFDWMKEELLKAYHEKKVSNQNLDNKAIGRLIDKALQKIN
jgi:hypothetical protein